MKKIVYSILILITAFLLNIWLYFYSENYSFFLKKMKYWDSMINKESLNITDDYSLPNKEACNCDNIKPVSCEKTNTWKIISENVINNVWTLSSSWEINEFFTYFDKNTLKIKWYDQYYQIFGITDEYPTEYITYNNENFEAYLFLSWKFDDIYNMFELLMTDKTIVNKFTLNKTNTFGKKSFFINTLKDDWKVKLVAYNWKILFWLNIKKSYYNNIKTILEKF